MTHSNRKVIIAHSGRQHSYHVAYNLKLLNSLASFYTSSYVSSGVLQELVNTFNNSFFKKRFLDGLKGAAIHSNWLLEMPEFFARMMKADALHISRLVCERDEKFDRKISRLLASQPFDIFWGYQGSCLSALQKANELDKISIVEMTMSYVPFANAILKEEARINPEWRDSIDNINYPASYEKRLTEEPFAAKKIIALSSFLKQTLIAGGADADKIHILPLGFDISRIKYSEQTVSIDKRPLKLLFVGRITQGKGIKYMLDAVEQISSNDIELHIVGKIIGSGSEFFRRKHLYTYHASMSQEKLFSFYKEFDVFLFPSLLEGFPLAVIEAMGAGLPVITTPNTSAEELIVEGETGFTVPIRNSNAIVGAIDKFRSMNNDRFVEMRVNARNKALHYTWDTYRERLKDILAEL